MDTRGVSACYLSQCRQLRNFLGLIKRDLAGNPVLIAQRQRIRRKQQDIQEINDAVDGILNLINKRT